MNRIYRLVWNPRLNAFVVGSELAAARGRRKGAGRTPALLASPLLAGLLAAGWHGGAMASDPRIAELLDLAGKYAAPATPAPVASSASESSAGLGGTPSSGSTALSVSSAVTPLRLAARTASPASAPVRNAAGTSKTSAANLRTALPTTLGLLDAAGGLVAGSAPAGGGGLEEPLAQIVAKVQDGIGSSGGGELVGGLLEGLPVGRDNPVGPVKDVLATVASLVEDGHGGSLPASLGGVLTGTVPKVGNGTAGLLEASGLGATTAGVVEGVAALVEGAGVVVGGTLHALTGSQALATTVADTTAALGGGLEQTVANLQQGDLVGVVGSLGSTVGNAGGGLVSGVTGAVDGLTGSTSGIGGTLAGAIGGLGNGLGSTVEGVLSLGTPAATASGAPAVPAASGSPGLVIGTGGFTGSLGQLLDPTLTDLLGGDGYVRNGNLSINNANVVQAYSSVSVLGIPLVNLSPVGTLLDGLGGATTGGNSHLTLIGGVTSDSYIYNINNGDPNGLLGLVLPDNAPAWASECLNVLGVATADCWAVNAAQDYQVLIGDGAYANGSKEVVIGTNARHALAQQDASQAFPGAGLNDPDNPTGVPTADYDARLGHSVVIGDSASGTANAQTLIGAGATSDKANTVALGYLSNADRGGQDGYTAFGLSTPQTSIGEVAVGSAGRERQITHVAAGSAATDAVNVAQLQGALDQIGVMDLFAVTYDTDAAGNPDYTRVTLGTIGAGSATVIGNLAAGVVASGSLEAINGAQLYALGQGTALHLGGGSGVDANGVPTAPLYVINNIGVDGTISAGRYTDVGSALDAISQSLANVGSGDDGGSGGTDARAVRYDAGAGGGASNRITLSGDGSGAAVAIGNLAAGAVSAASGEAINGSQLYQTNTQVAEFLGGGAQYDSSTQAWTGPQYQITTVGSTGATTTATYGDVGSAFAAVDGSLVNVNQRIDNLQTGGSDYLSVNSDKAAAAATGTDAVAIGPVARASGTGSVAVGDAATASAAGSVALGAGSLADRANSVSVGSSGAERQITHVAAGTAATDAVNLAQLDAGLADAMDWSRGYTDQRIDSLGRDVRRVDNRASAGVASAMAMASLPQPSEAGRNMASIAASTFSGESGIAVGLAGVTEGGRWIYKLSGSTNTRGQGGVSIGAGIQW